MHSNTQPATALKLPKLTARLGLCAAALAGALSMAPAQAVVVINTTSLSIPNTGDGLYINFVTGATGSTGSAGYDFNPYSVGGTIAFFFGGAASPNNGGVATLVPAYVDLSPGTVIGAASTFSQNAQTTATAAFQTAGIHNLGVRFQNEATGAVNYGYVTMRTGTGGFPATILGWAYENSGSSITFTAPIPEPSTTLMLSLGALAIGALALRRKPA